MYVLRIEIELADTADDVGARMMAMDVLDAIEDRLPWEDGRTVKLQKRFPNQPPKTIRID